MHPKKNSTSLLTFVFLAIVFVASGQTRITGTILSDEKELLPGISLLVHPDQNDNNIISFAITNNEGVFNLQFTHSSDSIALAVKSLSYKDTILLLPNQNQEIILELEQHLRQIKEVNVTGYPITSRGDTLNYIVNSFARESDQSIGDVISRMPGFEVNELGRIYYQGRPIQKYYIEGMDLLEQRYTLANRNLPHASVGSVEVLQNHQPIKMLENKMPSDETSINIRLKNNVAVTGSLYAGAGWTPLLHDVNITPMLFHKNQQLVASWQSNNAGDDLNTQHQPMEFTGGQLEGINIRKPELLGITTIAQPQIEKQRFLDNHANLLSYNHLFKLRNETELKVNSSFYNDIIRERGNMQTRYFLEDQQVTITELTKNNYHNKSLNTDLTLIQNEKNRYITNKLSIQKFWDSGDGLLKNRDSLTQQAETPHFSVANHLDVVIPVSRNFLQFVSFTDFNHSPQELTVSPLPEALNNEESSIKGTQNITERNLITHNYIKYSFVRKSWTLTTETGFRHEDQSLKSFLLVNDLPLEADSLHNHLRWNYQEGYVKEIIAFKRNRLITSLELPASRFRYRIEDKFHDVPTDINKIIFSPLLYMKYNLTKNLTGRITMGYNFRMDEVNTLAQGYILTGYRQLSKGTDKLAEKESLRFNLGIEYKNPVSGFFSSAALLSIRSKQNLLLNQRINGSGFLYTEAVKANNQRHSDNLSVSISQYLVKLRATVDLKAYCNQTRREYLLNNKRGWLIHQLYALHPGISINRWRNIDLEYSYNFQYMNQTSEQTVIKVTEQKHKGSVFLKPGKKHLAGIHMEYYSTHQINETYSDVFFTNLSYLFKPEKGKWKLKLDARNIFNETTITRHYNSDISLIQTSYSIRPREFLVTFLLGL